MTRGLPVLAKCGQCCGCRRPPSPSKAWCGVFDLRQRERGIKEPTEFLYVDANASPPDGCPLPRAEPDRDLAAAVLRAYEPRIADSEIAERIDAVLSARKEKP